MILMPYEETNARYRSGVPDPAGVIPLRSGGIIGVKQGLWIVSGDNSKGLTNCL